MIAFQDSPKAIEMWFDRGQDTPDTSSGFKEIMHNGKELISSSAHPKTEEF